MNSISGKLMCLIIISSFFTAISFANEVEVNIGEEGDKIYGTLISTGGKTDEIVIFVSGSGPTDRDGNSLMLPGKNNSLKQLAEALAENGIASLRYDKRMIGQSQGSMTEKDLRFEIYIDDLVKWVAYLRDKGYKSITIAGHSEGSLIGMIAAKKANADKFISLVGVGTNASQTIIEQINKQAPQFAAETQAILDSLNAGKTVDNVNPMLAALFRPGVQPYLISWFKYDPRVEIAKLEIPVLIINGTEDIQVPIHNADELNSANPKSRLLIIENMNHVLKEIPAGDQAANMAAYKSLDYDLPDQLINSMVEFIQE